MSDSNLKNVSKISMLADSLLTGTYHTLHRFQGHRLEMLGEFALLFIPVLDVVKFLLYFFKSQNEQYTKRKGEKYATISLIIHGYKAAMTSVGLVAILAGSALLGFGLIAVANGMIACRSLYKAGHALYVEKNVPKTIKHLAKFVVSALYTTAFTMIFLFPPIAAPSIVAWGLVIAATGIAMLGSFFNRKTEDIQPSIFKSIYGKQNQNPEIDNGKPLFLEAYKLDQEHCKKERKVIKKEKNRSDQIDEFKSFSNSIVLSNKAIRNGHHQ